MPFIHSSKKSSHTVDGKKPAPVDRSCIQVFPVFLYISGGAGFFPSTVLLMEKNPVTVEPCSFGWSTP